ncbi:hypothetical protein [Spirosoma endophyticum]|uniref:Uncharacterized protein n=1 Tax=Spirosoma endophyticum TaxID=662367 RepID=A0A1I1SU42_9BACT|nr:hypothetical protein [Spirosoma endophyticum]SFD47423.1 hypothetical protein SAMN05216167_105154 [Spirosoma endophyticum]
MQLPILFEPEDLVFPQESTNVGGLRTLRICPARHVSLIAPERFALPQHLGYSDFTVSSQHLIFSAGAILTNVDVIPDYCSFSDDMETSGHGELFKPTIQLILPKVRPDVVVWVQKYRAVRWLAFLEDRNGYCRLAGTPEQPLELGVKSGQELGKGRNQTVLTFSGLAQQPAYFLTGITDADLMYEGPFDPAFGFAFDA